MLKMKDVPTTADNISGPLGPKCIKEDEHMHSQKNFGGQKDFAEIRCALATATCLQHPEREARSGLISSGQRVGWALRTGLQASGPSVSARSVEALDQGEEPEATGDGAGQRIRGLIQFCDAYHCSRSTYVSCFIASTVAAVGL